MLFAVCTDCSLVHPLAVCSPRGDFLFHSPDGDT